MKVGKNKNRKRQHLLAKLFQAAENGWSEPPYARHFKHPDCRNDNRPTNTGGILKGLDK
jgi:hypothetical protein